MLTIGPCCSVVMEMQDDATVHLQPNLDENNELEFYSDVDENLFIYFVESMWFMGEVLYSIDNFLYAEPTSDVECIDLADQLWFSKNEMNEYELDDGVNVRCASDWQTSMWYEISTSDNCTRDVFCLRPDFSPLTPKIVDDLECETSKPESTAPSSSSIECISPGTCDDVCISVTSDIPPVLNEIVDQISGTYVLMPDIDLDDPELHHREVYVMEGSRRVLSYWKQAEQDNVQLMRAGWIIDTVAPSNGVPEWPFEGFVQSWAFRARETTGTWFLYDGDGLGFFDYHEVNLLITCGGCSS